VPVRYGGADDQGVELLGDGQARVGQLADHEDAVASEDKTPLIRRVSSRV
jgi:hypothetical protein